MAHPIGPGNPGGSSDWHSPAHIYNRGQMMACLRAGVIALILLAVLAFIVLY